MTPKKPGWEERASEFEVSFINQPVEVDFVVEPKTAKQRALRKGWRILKGGVDDKNQATEKTP
jgi:hypothetical protein